MGQKIGESRPTIVSVVVLNACLYLAAVQVRRFGVATVRSRAVVQQAKGIVMGGQRCSEGDAFMVLVQTAEEQGVSVAQAAAAIVARTIRG